MKVFVATEETQGQRKSDFCFVPEGELVRFGFECDTGKNALIDGACGCQRSMDGVECHKGTTTFKVVEFPDMTEADFAEAIKLSYGKSWEKLFTDEEIAEWSATEAKELARLADVFEVGTILEKRGPAIQTREIPPALSREARDRIHAKIMKGS